MVLLKLKEEKQFLQHIEGALGRESILRSTYRVQDVSILSQTIAVATDGREGDAARRARG